MKPTLLPLSAELHHDKLKPYYNLSVNSSNHNISLPSDKTMQLFILLNINHNSNVVNIRIFGNISCKFVAQNFDDHINWKLIF